MVWNYRIIKSRENLFGLHEVYYDERGTVMGWTESPVLVGENSKDIIRDLEMMLKDCRKLSVLQEKLL